ncbi:S-adenosyl-L-methionine dependent methyltransferase [Vibrio ishigakensis]|uniref:S-adenosyl-L-methionine dependent methyltransferase n=1 Tax=Vibrio ishigakensis TaxID=1481914 RepID=A0A0B8Q9F1_9VIBR|nr:S-adenosyl-L-methionine dependent methyltransferase [Vibrio ishigakensis]
MLYSAGVYQSGEDSLEQAQLNKMERLCQQLELKETDSVIEIGTGWGAWLSTWRKTTAAMSPPLLSRMNSTTTLNSESSMKVCKTALRF